MIQDDFYMHSIPEVCLMLPHSALGTCSRATPGRRKTKRSDDLLDLQHGCAGRPHSG